jgi:hypothetical protein
MEPDDLEHIKKLRAQLELMQDRCEAHQFTLMGRVDNLRFDADRRFGAICDNCILRINFSSWDRCPNCFNDLSEVQPSRVPGQFQGSGPVDDGQDYALPTLEKRCTCGATVWKDET